MKKPSRYMPKYKPNEASIYWWCFPVIALAAFIYACYSEPTILAIVACLILITYLWSKIKRPALDRQYEDTLKKREGLSICNFAREFNPRETDIWIIRAVYEQIQDYFAEDRKLPIKASDDLIKDLGFESEDIEDIAGEVAQRTNRSLENYEINPYYGKVNTARDMVLFFNNQPKLRET